MSSSIASSLLRRTLRLPFAYSNLCRNPRPRFHSSLPSSALTRRAIIPRSLEKPSSLLHLRSASSKVVGGADENLKQVLDSEIDCAKQEQGQEVALPDGFPFEIIDNPGDQTITLKREFTGESVQVTVFMNPEEEEADVEDNEDGSGDDNSDSSIQPTISLVAMIDKGGDHVLEFCCNLNADEVSIESMVLKKQDDSDDQGAYQGPDFSDLDESLQKAMHKYLEVRGIKGSLFDFLQEYMMNKDDREYMTWLKNMKQFVEK